MYVGEEKLHHTAILVFFSIVSLRSATNASVKRLGTLRYNQLARNSSNLRNVRLE